MNDPHVVALRYRLKTGEASSYVNPPAVTIKQPKYEMTLDDGILTVTMVEHHPTVGGAMARVGSYLRAWELQAALDMGLGNLAFEFVDADVVDRNPPPPGTPVVSTGSVAMAAGSSSAWAVGHVSRVRYPDPPKRFKASTTVEHLWKRYLRYLEGKDLLTTMGYFCLSTIQREAGGRAKAVSQYKIDKDVLDKLGTLTSDVGDETTARKIDQHSTLRAHTEPEKAWVEAAARKVIRRLAELEADPLALVAPITMADLPAT